MKNPRLTAKERNLVKGALRRVFARSELHRQVLDEAEIKHHDPDRPRVTRWCRCAICGKPVARYQTHVDHILPLVPVTSTLADMTADELIDRLWCDIKGLQAADPVCHSAKTKAENKERRLIKKGKSNNGTPG